MSKREKMKTSVKGIVDYWSKYVDECGLSVDWAEADHRCWRCGYEDNLQRCHIIPDALGGKDEPSNLVLLCERCHADGPNVEDPEIMWDWIRAYGVPFYDTFWIIMGRKEYKFIYGHSFEKELERIFECSNTEIDEKTRLDLVREKMSKTMERTGLHFGQTYLNMATMAGVYRMTLKEIAKELDVDFPIKDENKNIEQPWWV